MDHIKKLLEVIIGCMFAGKTSELINRLIAARDEGSLVLAFKPDTDTRGDPNKLTAHNGLEFPAISVGSAREILEHVKRESNTSVVGIDEAQFFHEDILWLIYKLMSMEIRVVVAGLPLDFRGEPFGHMPHLVCLAGLEQVTELTAICEECGQPASRTYRHVNGSPARYGDPIIMIGAKDEYGPRCPKHSPVLDRPW